MESRLKLEAHLKLEGKHLETRPRVNDPIKIPSLRGIVFDEDMFKKRDVGKSKSPNIRHDVTCLHHD